MSLFGKREEAAPQRKVEPLDSRSGATVVGQNPTPLYGQGENNLPAVDDAEMLFNRLSQSVMIMLRIIEDERYYENGEPIYTLSERMKAFDQCQRWLDKLLKFKPREIDTAPGVEFLKQILKDPGAIAALEESGVVMLPDASDGRDTRHNAKRRAKVKQVRKAALAVAADTDDSQLKSLIQGKIKTSGSPRRTGQPESAEQ